MIPVKPIYLTISLVSEKKGNLKELLHKVGLNK